MCSCEKTTPANHFGVLLFQIKGIASTYQLWSIVKMVIYGKLNLFAKTYRCVRKEIAGSID